VAALRWTCGIVVAAAIATAGGAALAKEESAPRFDSLTSLEMVGRYGELAQLAQKKLAAQGRPTTSIVAPLCTAYSRLKDYGKLFPCLDRLEALVLAGDTVIVTDRWDISNSDATPLASMLRAEALVELGNYRKAIEEANAALGRIQDRLSYGIWWNKTYRIALYPILGVAYALAGEREPAMAQVKRLEDFPIGFMGWAGFRILRENAIARIQVALGDHAGALKHLEEDGSLVRSIFIVNDVAWGFTGEDAAETYMFLPKLLMRGKCRLETGDLEGAKADFGAALRNQRIADFGEIHWQVLFERGRIAEREGDDDGAIELYRRAIEVIERQRASIATEAAKIGFAGDKQQAYARLVAKLVARGRAADAFDFVERAKSRALVDLLASRTDFASRELEAGRAAPLVSRLDVADRAVRIQDDSARGTRSAEALALKAVQEEIRRAAPELASLVTVTSIAADEVRRLLGPDETLVEYYYHGADLYAFVATPGKLSVAKLDGEGMAFQVRSLREAVQRADTPRWRDFSRALYDRLWKPIEALVGTPRVVVVPHGVLHYLPFAALERADGQQVVDQVGLRFLPSASVLKFVRAPTGAASTAALVLGNPDLGDPALDLAFGEQEATAVAGQLPQSQLLLRASASETNFRRLGAQYRRIHFATHGKFQAQDALNSGLFLARDAQNDGVLTVGELYGLPIDADLVTLSACETGLGRIASGDDVVGLTRGFLYAGASSVVASLWSVEDKATAGLMGAFYANLATRDRQEALREAQLATRKVAPHPFYWAAFQLIGQAGSPPPADRR
jgi:CHAT domain-containing protein/tetratricopeptide (TPR) repeat protein